jgi:hypothetical protein
VYVKTEVGALEERKNIESKPACRSEGSLSKKKYTNTIDSRKYTTTPGERMEKRKYNFSSLRLD